MKNKISAVLLLAAIVVLSFGKTAFFAESNNVGEYTQLLDAIIVYNLNLSQTEDVSEWIASGAGSGTDFYAISLSQLGEWEKLSAYAVALEKYVSENDVKSAVTKQKHGLALIAAGKRDSEKLIGLADSTIGELGIMSYVYGLFLLNNGAPSEKYTALGIAEELVSKQFDDGGWALSGQYSDVDVTAMTVQALAPHIENSEAIAEAVDRAISFLSQKQLEDGGFQSYGTKNAESAAQVIITLTSLGVDPENDERFIKNGNSPFDGMMKFRLEDGSFCHEEGKDSNGMATYQAFMAISSIIRFYRGQGPLYVIDCPAIYEEETPSEPDFSETEANGRTEEQVLPITEQEQTHEQTEDALTGEKNEEKPSENSNKPFIAAAVIFAGAVLIAICIIKKQKPATYIFVIVLTAAVVSVIFLTDVQTPEQYYGSTKNKENSVGTVSIQIRCDIITEFDSEYIPKDGVILPKTYFDIEDGDTVYDILVEAVKKYSIHIETTGPKNMVYVNGINHLYEFDYGDLSGWIYKVNDVTVSVGCGQCILQNGDEIVWHYTRNLGLDLD